MKTQAYIPAQSDNWLVTVTRDGQAPKKFMTIFADYFEKAKEKFTAIRRESLSDKSDVAYYEDAKAFAFDDRDEEDRLAAPYHTESDFDKPGYYDLNYKPAGLILADDEVIDQYSEDVYTYKLHKHEFELKLWKVLGGELVSDDPYLEAFVADQADAELFAQEHLPSINCDSCLAILYDILGNEVWIEEFSC